MKTKIFPVCVVLVSLSCIGFFYGKNKLRESASENDIPESDVLSGQAIFEKIREEFFTFRGNIFREAKEVDIVCIATLGGPQVDNVQEEGVWIFPSVSASSAGSVVESSDEYGYMISGVNDGRKIHAIKTQYRQKTYLVVYLDRVDRETGEDEEMVANIQGFIHEGELVYYDASGEMQQWDNRWSFSDGLAMVKKNGKHGYINQEGEVISRPQWDLAVSFSEGLAMVRKEDKWGYINQAGEVVIEPQWDLAVSFSEGLAWVRKGDKYGYINQAGEILGEQLWDAAGYFDEGLAKVRKDGKVGYIDTTGEIVSWGEERPDTVEVEEE